MVAGLCNKTASTQRQVIVVFYGLPGTGKTTLARSFANAYEGIYLGTDEVRKRVISRPSYSQAEKAIIYNTLMMLAEHVLKTGQTPVLDGTFARAGNRKAALSLGNCLGVPILLIQCHCPDELSLRRIRERNDSLSEADSTVYARLKGEWEQEPTPDLLLDTDQNLCSNLERVLVHVMKALPSVPLTPQDVNLLGHPDILIAALRRLKQFFQKIAVPWYIQSSLATNLHGVSDRIVTDIDVRAGCSMEHLFEEVRQDIDPSATLRGPVTYGQGEFRNSCIIMDLPQLGTHIDITTVIHTYRADGQVLLDVPFDPNPILMRVHEDCAEVFPVCSLEYLVIYKLVNQRGADERKNDLGEVASLLNSLRSRWKSRH